MIGRTDLQDVDRALAEIEVSFPVGSTGVLQGDKTDTMIQIVEHGVLPTGDPMVPVEASLTLAIAYRVVGKLPLGRTARIKVFPKIHEHGIRGVRERKFEVVYLNLDAKKAG